MADAAPQKKSGPGRWILLGCGILTGVFVLGMGGCAGIFYLIYKGTDSIAEVGAGYLREHSDVRKAFGGKVDVRRSWSGWNVQTADGKGDARIAYELRGVESGKTAKAVVWLMKDDGAWRIYGARIQPESGDEISFGSPPKAHHRIDWD